VVDWNASKHGVVFNLRLAERRDVAGDQNNFCCEESKVSRKKKEEIDRMRPQGVK
jgi:hypothetical protein